VPYRVPNFFGEIRLKADKLLSGINNTYTNNTRPLLLVYVLSGTVSRSLLLFQNSVVLSADKTYFRHAQVLKNLKLCGFNLMVASFLAPSGSELATPFAQIFLVVTALTRSSPRSVATPPRLFFLLKKHDCGSHLLGCLWSQIFCLPSQTKFRDSYRICTPFTFRRRNIQGLAKVKTFTFSPASSVFSAEKT